MRNDGLLPCPPIGRWSDRASERTLSTAVVPPGISHVNASVSTVFGDTGLCCDFAAVTAIHCPGLLRQDYGHRQSHSVLSPPPPLLPPDCDPYISLPSAFEPSSSTASPLIMPTSGENSSPPDFSANAGPNPTPASPRPSSRASPRSWTRNFALRTDYASSPSTGRDRCPHRYGLRSHPRRTLHHLPRPVPRPHPERARYLVRPQRPHCVHRLQGPRRGRPSA